MRSIRHAPESELAFQHLERSSRAEAGVPLPEGTWIHSPTRLQEPASALARLFATGPRFGEFCTCTGAGKSLKIPASTREKQRKSRAVPTKPLAETAAVFESLWPMFLRHRKGSRKDGKEHALLEHRGEPPGVQATAAVQRHVLYLGEINTMPRGRRGAGRSMRSTKMASKPDESRCFPRIGQHRH